MAVTLFTEKKMRKRSRTTATNTLPNKKSSLASIQAAGRPVSVRFCKTGVPWRFDNGISGILRGLTREQALAEAYKREPKKAPFEPFVLTGFLCPFVMGEEESYDVFTNVAVCLSNGNGGTRPMTKHNLKPDGTVRYYYFDEKGNLCGPQTYSRNVPTWKLLYHRESYAATMTLLCGWKRSVLHTQDRNVICLIAKMVYDSFEDEIWKLTWFTKNNNNKRRRRK